VVVLVLLFIALPISELYVFVQASHAIGFFSSLGLLIGISVLGGWLVKHQGMRVWKRFNAQIARGVVPSKEIADGVLLLMAGVLLLTPGFITDAFGLLLMLPPVRALVRGRFVKRMGKRQVITATYGGPRPGPGIIDVGSEDDDD
jgi:UPF0716 protein FxsA